MRRTPPIGARGVYELRSPWVASASKIYICHAVRTFKDLYERNIDVFEQFYQGLDLTKTEFEADKRNNVNIVTLIAEEDNEIIYVPDSYIASYPNMGTINYQRMVLSVDLGALPDYLDVSFLSTQIKELTDKTIGNNSSVKLHVAPTSGIVRPNDHQTLEAARRARIENTNTTYSRWKAVEAENAQLRALLSRYEQIIIDNNLVDSAEPTG